MANIKSGEYQLGDIKVIVLAEEDVAYATDKSRKTFSTNQEISDLSNQVKAVFGVERVIVTEGASAHYQPVLSSEEAQRWCDQSYSAYRQNQERLKKDGHSK